jgi:hypothetical protein
MKLQEESNMDEALRHSAVLLGELRTSLLGPQKYYELYMAVNNEMRDLEVRCISFVRVHYSKILLLNRFCCVGLHFGYNG